MALCVAEIAGIRIRRNEKRQVKGNAQGSAWWKERLKARGDATARGKKVRTHKGTQDFQRKYLEIVLTPFIGWQRLKVILGKLCFLLGWGWEGGSGYFRNFLGKKSWPSHFPEWINAWPFTNTYTKTSDPPPTSSKTKIIGSENNCKSKRSASPEKWKHEDLGWFPNPKGGYTKFSNSILPKFYVSFWTTCPYKERFGRCFVTERNCQWEVREALKAINHKLAFVIKRLFEESELVSGAVRLLESFQINTLSPKSLRQSMLNTLPR